MKIDKTTFRVITIALVIILLVGSYFTGKNTANRSDPVVDTVNIRDNYPLLATRIFIDNPADSIVNFSNLRSSLEDHVETNSIEGSIYFEYLPTGTSIRVGAERREVAASLMKLPAAMSLYKASELGRIDLDNEISLKQEWLDPDYGDLYLKGAGYTMTLRDATRVMLTNSDNTALKAVANSIPPVQNTVDNPFASLDIDIVQNNNLTVSISARSYSSILKCLYFSCYLNKQNSQELLRYLDDSIFTERLRAGVSDDSIPIAHKVGNYTQDTQSDCGIVYIPRRNYILCVMIKVADNPEGDKKIAEISKIVYDFMDQLPD